MLIDPFPRAVALGLPQLGELLSMGRSELYEFLKEPPPGFPAPLVLGKTRNRKDRLRWDKVRVYEWFARYRQGDQFFGPKP